MEVQGYSSSDEYQILTLLINCRYAVGQWIGNGSNFTIVDTPGFGDSDNDDNELLDEMVETLKDTVKTTNGFVLLFNGQNDRFDGKSQQMIREMEAMFGNGFWDHVHIAWEESLRKTKCTEVGTAKIQNFR